ncbi:MAG: DUF92 domain-containing protein [Candidatus Delongbacteria bacterium]|nr:DUF92 domain-containing protein [Candidatus Delongbacteria bacterium]
MIYLDILLFTGILALILILVRGISRSVSDPFLSRKLIHIAVGSLVSLSLYFFTHWIFLMALALIFMASNLKDILSGRIEAMSARNRNWGTLFFPISFLFLLAWWGYDHRELILTAMLILTFSDSLAGLAGYYRGGQAFRLFHEMKTGLGCLVFGVTSLLLIWFSLCYWYAIPILLGWWGALMIALVLTVIESFSVVGIDNLTLPVMSAFLLHWFILDPIAHGRLLFLGIALAGLIVGMAVRWGWLDYSGATAAFLIGSLIIAFGGLAWLLPMMVFFVSGSWLSHYRKDVKNQLLDHESGYRRNGIQVLANGGLAIVLAIAFGYSSSPVWVIAYVAMMSAMNSDTWASEIGMLSSQSPYLITRFRNLQAGVSGAVSHLGLVAGFAGSLVAALSLYGFGLHWRFSTILVIAYIGWMAHLLDSLLGALCQARFQCSRCGKITESNVHCQSPARLVYGKSFITNDMVNLISAGTACIAGAWMSHSGCFL